METLLAPDTEVVLHDLRLVPSSIVAISGSVTGRTLGDPMTDFLLRQIRLGRFRDVFNYTTELPNGREGRSTTVLVRTSAGKPVAALCVNRDMTGWRHAADLLGTVVASNEVETSNGTADVQEFFPRSVDELVSTAIESAVANVGLPVELMKKSHKLQVVGDLDRRGIFMIRDSIETTAKALAVTRYTVYNYLKELTSDDE